MDHKVFLTNDDHSPLHRIMAVYDPGVPGHQKFSNNICAFHIGGGYILSVAHNLRAQEALPWSVPAAVWSSSVQPKLSPADYANLLTFYQLDAATGKYHLANVTPQTAPRAIDIVGRTGLDRRFVSLYQGGVCVPCLIVQFREDRFYSLTKYDSVISPRTHLYEADLGRHTFTLELELLQAFYEQDWSVYRIKDADQTLLRVLPSTQLDSATYPSLTKDFYCLQAAPINNLGRMLNSARIDGLLDHFNVFNDPIGGNYFMQGLRYLISGYFRFGSSGAPYLRYHRVLRRFLVNAIQSEACPLQLTIAGNRENNFQYVNAIASPISNVKRELQEVIGRAI